MESQQRLVVVSNRLPVTVRRHGDGWKVHASAGGLVTAMKPILDRTNGIWIGWPGDSSGIGDSRRQEAINHWAQREEYVIVDIPQKTADLFYEGYCNQTIWPLFHYFPSLLSYEPKGWTAYVDVNKRFCDAVVRHSRPGDLIWVHDYQLMLLPHLLREAMPDARIGSGSPDRPCRSRGAGRPARGAADRHRPGRVPEPVDWEPGNFRIH